MGTWPAPSPPPRSPPRVVLSAVKRWGKTKWAWKEVAGRSGWLQPTRQRVWALTSSTRGDLKRRRSRRSCPRWETSRRRSSAALGRGTAQNTRLRGDASPRADPRMIYPQRKKKKRNLLTSKNTETAELGKKYLPPVAVVCFFQAVTRDSFWFPFWCFAYSRKGHGEPGGSSGP